MLFRILENFLQGPYLAFVSKVDIPWLHATQLFDARDLATAAKPHRRIYNQDP